MIARIVPYRIPVDELDALEAEIVERARASWPVGRTNRRAEFFFVDPRGDGLSVLVGDDPTVSAVIDLARRPSADAEELDVTVLQLGGPKRSGIVEALYGRVVRCAPDVVAEQAADLPAPSTSDLWARALLVSPDRDRALGVAVGTTQPALEEALAEFTLPGAVPDDYREVAYHFLGRVADE